MGDRPRMWPYGKRPWPKSRMARRFGVFVRDKGRCRYKAPFIRWGYVRPRHPAVRKFATHEVDMYNNCVASRRGVTGSISKRIKTSRLSHKKRRRRRVLL